MNGALSPLRAVDRRKRAQLPPLHRPASAEAGRAVIVVEQGAAASAVEVDVSVTMMPWTRPRLTRHLQRQR